MFICNMPSSILGHSAFPITLFWHLTAVVFRLSNFTSAKSNVLCFDIRTSTFSLKTCVFVTMLWPAQCLWFHCPGYFRNVLNRRSQRQISRVLHSPCSYSQTECLYLVIPAKPSKSCSGRLCANCFTLSKKSVQTIAVQTKVSGTFQSIVFWNKASNP